MRSISEQQIAAMAPNANAAANAKKIVNSKGFISFSRSADDTFYMGLCRGSGSSSYTVSLDFIEGDTPVCRCSCPSRQFPCKHGLALMMELSRDRQWEICEIPQTILDKRAKKEARAGKKEDKSEGESAGARAPKKTNQAARAKKLKKQLEGLDLAERVMRELVEAGLGTLNGTSVKVYQDLAKQLGDYYLPGLQRLVQSLVLEIERIQEKETAEYQRAVSILIHLRALIKKSRTYLNEKLENGQMEDDNSVLYEELGGIWTLERLRELGLEKKNVNLLQLAFNVYYDAARKEYVDKGWWIDTDCGEISVTYNYRPVRALKYVKEEDSVMDAVKIPSLVSYPGEGSRRVRWESQEFSPVNRGLLEQVRKKAAASLPPLVKEAKNVLKGTLSDGRFGCLIAFSALEQTREEQPVPVLRCVDGNIVELRDRPGDSPSVPRLRILPDRRLADHQVMFGILWFDEASHKIYMQPYSVVTENEIVRLLY